MKYRKRREVRDVQMHEAPQLIHNYDPKTGRGPLHIADKHGVHGGEHKDITRCGRAMSPDWRGFRDKETLDSFRLCARCGSRSEFEQAVAGADEHRRQWAEAERLRREQENATREAVWNDKVRRVNELAALLVEAGWRVGVKNGTATIEHGGFEFQLTALAPISDNSDLTLEAQETT